MAGLRVPDLRGNGRKKLLVLGCTGDGKSTLCNTLSGHQPEDSGLFQVSSGALSCTQETQMAEVFFNGEKEKPVSLIDTVGWSDGGSMTDAKIIEELIQKLKASCDYINLFILVVNGQAPRLTSTTEEMARVFQGMFSDSFWSNLVVVVTRLKMNRRSVERRRKTEEKTDDDRAQDYVEHIKTMFRLENPPRYLIIDAWYDDEDEDEVGFFSVEMTKLYRMLADSARMPTVNVEKVKTENMKLQEMNQKYEREIRAQKEELEKLARKAEEQDERERRRRRTQDDEMKERQQRLGQLAVSGREVIRVEASLGEI